MAFVETRVEDGIGWLVLNDPDRLNPVTYERIAEISRAAKELSVSDQVEVVIVTGAGRAFCAGADLSSVDTFLSGASPPASGSVTSDPGLWILTAIRHPVIAMINGPAVGFGFEFALQADIRIAADSARLGHPAVKLGTITDTAAATWLLPRLVGWSRALEMLYSGRLYDADECHRMGVVNHVVPDAELEQFALGVAEEIKQGSAWALRTTKRLVYKALESSAHASISEQFLHVNAPDRSFDPSERLAPFRRDNSA